MALKPSNFKPTFGKWIYTGYHQPEYSDLYVFCIHALKRSLHMLVDTKRANRLEFYLSFIEKPIYDDVEVSDSFINDLKELRIRLSDQNISDESEGYSIVKEIFGDCDMVFGESDWNSWVYESKIAIDMFLRYIRFRGTKSELCGQQNYIRDQYLSDIVEKKAIAERLNRNEIKLTYNPNLLIVHDDKGIRGAVRSALYRFKINESCHITKVEIISDMITLTFE